jgi:hypothetical protein
MIDPIQSAINKTKAAANSSLPNVNNLAGAANLNLANSLSNTTDAANKNIDLINSKLELLASFKEKELLLAEKKALAFEKKAEASRLLDRAQEASVEQLMESARKLVLRSVPYPVKLPTINPKTLRYRIVQTVRNQARKIKQKLSRIQLEQGEKIFKYNMKPPTAIPTKIPNIPKVSLPKTFINKNN